MLSAGWRQDTTSSTTIVEKKDRTIDEQAREIQELKRQLHYAKQQQHYSDDGYHGHPLEQRMTD